MNEDPFINPCQQQDDSVTPPYSPLAVMKLDFGNLPSVAEDVLLDKTMIGLPEETELEQRMRIFETEMEISMPSTTPVEEKIILPPITLQLAQDTSVSELPLHQTSKEQKLDKRKQMHMQQVYNSRRTTAVDKFLEQAIMRCSMKQNHHNNLTQLPIEPKPVDIKPVVIQKKPVAQRKSMTSHASNLSTIVLRNNRQSIVATEKQSLARQPQPLIHKVTQNLDKKYASAKVIEKKPNVPKQTKQKSIDMKARDPVNVVNHNSNRIHMRNQQRKDVQDRLTISHRTKTTQPSCRSASTVQHSRNSKSVPRPASDLLPKISKKSKRSRGASLTIPRTLENTNKIEEEGTKVNIQNIRKKMMIFKQKMNSYAKEMSMSTL